MSINIIGDAPTIKRLETGLHSFDRAFENRKGEIGFPLGKGIEVFGATHIGKSTIAYGLAGIIASIQERNIALADLEGFDPDFLITVLENSGFSGDVYNIQEDTDEKALDKLASFVKDDDYGVAILDTIGAISPISEQEGAIGEASMGRRAKIMAQFVRKCMKRLRKPNAPTIFMVNHEYPRIGGLGSITPGGEIKKYLASMRVKVKRVYYKNKYAEYPDGSYVIEGKVIKNRWGFKDRPFWLFVLAGRGISKGMTAIYDASRLDLLTLDRNIVKIGDTSFGHIKKLIQEAQDGNEEPFEIFYELLRSQDKEIENETI
jgi:recombination protein RecA